MVTLRTVNLKMVCELRQELGSEQMEQSYALLIPDPHAELAWVWHVIQPQAFMPLVMSTHRH